MNGNCNRVGSGRCSTSSNLGLHWGSLGSATLLGSCMCSHTLLVACNTQTVPKEKGQERNNVNRKQGGGDKLRH